MKNLSLKPLSHLNNVPAVTCNASWSKRDYEPNAQTLHDARVGDPIVYSRALCVENRDETNESSTLVSGVRSSRTVLSWVGE